MRTEETATGFLRAMCAAFPALLDDGLDLDPHDLTAWLNDRLTAPENEELRALAAPVRNTTWLMVCRDCFDVVAGNTDNIDADREGEIMTALDRMTGTVSIDGAISRVDGWKNAPPCGVCGSTLGGSRYDVINRTKGGE